MLASGSLRICAGFHGFAIPARKSSLIAFLHEFLAALFDNSTETAGLTMTPNSILPTFRLEPGTAIAQTGPGSSLPVTIGSPALEVMTDLTEVKAATIGPLVALRQAEQTMVYLGVRMLFVVSDMPSIEGLITTTDLHGERQMRLVHESRVRYDDLCVADVMSGLSILDAIDLDRMKRAVVGDLIATLKRFGRNHLLVVEHETPPHPF